MDERVGLFAIDSHERGSKYMMIDPPYFPSSYISNVIPRKGVQSFQEKNSNVSFCLYDFLTPDPGNSDYGY